MIPTVIRSEVGFAFASGYTAGVWSLGLHGGVENTYIRRSTRNDITIMMLLLSGSFLVLHGRTSSAVHFYPVDEFYPLDLNVFIQLLPVRPGPKI